MKPEDVFVDRMLRLEDGLREYEQLTTEYLGFLAEMRAKYGIAAPQPMPAEEDA